MRRDDGHRADGLVLSVYATITSCAAGAHGIPGQGAPAVWGPNSPCGTGRGAEARERTRRQTYGRINQDVGKFGRYLTGEFSPE